MLFPATNAGGYTGLTGIIQYAAGSPGAVPNLAHIYNLTIDGDLSLLIHIMLIRVVI